MVKAAAGGGGRGMRLVQDYAELANAIKLARAEAESAFGSGELILEKAQHPFWKTFSYLFWCRHCYCFSLDD